MLAGFFILAVLLLASALMSGSEVAFFSFKPDDIERLKNNRHNNAKTALKLYNHPEKLLSTVLIANNTVNIAAVLLSAWISNRLFTFGSELAGFIVNALAITFLLLFFGEIMPKVYASGNYMKVALFMAYPMSVLEKLLQPLTSVMISTSAFVKKRSSSYKTGISIDDLSNALELTSGDFNEDGKILKGILNFGNINVSEIMCPRIDVTAFDIEWNFETVTSNIISSGFSRIPVYSGSFDNIRGILYAKDVLPYTTGEKNIKWQSLLRPPYFVPETKKINDLLKEFQTGKIHMAVVIDEYGGTSGIITLEDVLEEIVGEITDESDDDETMYRKIDENIYIFEGKILLNDFFKVPGIGDESFDDIRGESETLAGLILEITGEIPEKGKVVRYGRFLFTIESVDRKRIREIRLEITSEDETDE